MTRARDLADSADKDISGTLTVDDLTASGDVSVGGNLSVSGTTTTIDSANAQTVDLGDNDKIRLGDGDDLQIYHDGSNSYIDEQGTGSLAIRTNGNGVYLQNGDGTETLAAFKNNDSSDLYYDNSKKLATTSTGVDVTGDVIVKSGNEIQLNRADNARSMKLFTDNNAGHIQTTNDPIIIDAASGRIRFDIASSEKMRIDSSGNVGIGTSSPASILHVKGRTLAVDGAAASDSPRLNLDLDGTNKASILLNRVSEDLQLSVVGSNNMTFTTNSTERMRIDSSGNVGIGKTPAYVFDVEGSTSGNWLAHIHNSHATNGYGVKIRAGDDNNVSAFRVSSQDNATTILDCTGGGIVTKPNQPYFNVTRNGSSYTAANNSTLIFNRVMSNVGSHYSSSTGRFTAPVTGKYLFIFQSIVNGNYNNASVRFWKNGSRFYGSDVHFSPYLSSTAYWDGVHNNQIVAMNANDYIEVVNVGPTVTYHGDHWAHFTGMLLG